jgi:DME family drug/metabolite transporter
VPQTRLMTSSETTHVAPAWRGLLLVCLAGVIWGTIGPAVDVLDERSSLSVWMVGAYRAVTAVGALFLTVAVAGRLAQCRELVAAHPFRVIAVGVFTGTFMVLFFISVVSVGVSIATVVGLGWAPVLLQLFRIARTRRPPPLSEALTVGAALVGLVLICVAGGGDPDPSRPVLGVITALGSGTAFALSTEIVAPLKEHDALSVATMTMTVAAVVLVVAGGAAAARGAALATTDPTSWVIVLYLGVGTMALAYVLLYAGLRTTPSRTAVVATLLEPLTAVVIAVLLLGEHLTPAGAVGALLILAAIGSLGLQRPMQAPQ